MQWAKNKQTGFTIIEVLIVVIVIGILATIVVVAYNGIQNSSRESRVVNELTQIAKKLETTKSLATNVRYPDTLSAVGVGTTGVNLTYSVAALGKGYCLIAKDNGVVYSITQASQAPVKGSCGTVAGLVGWWPMNDSTNGFTTDYSGNRINGELKGGVAQTNGVTGAANTAFSFNGIDSQILCGTSDILRPTEAVSVTAWIRPNVVTGSVAGIVNNGTGGYWLNLSTSANLSFYISTNSVGNAARPVVANQWQFVVGRFVNGTGRSGVYTLNGGGVWQTSTTLPTTIYNYTNSGDQCQIGSIKNIAGRWFNGVIDDVRIYNKSLSDDEVQALYEAGAY
jgi:prepilin-type N-terminal cleavage/methylation domain-containing protein